MVEDYIAKFKEEMEPAPHPARKKAGLAICAVFLAVLIFAAAGCTGGGSNTVNEAAPPAEAPSQAVPGDDISNVPQGGDDIMVEPGSGTPDKAQKDVKAPKDDDVDVIANQDDKMVAVSVEDTGRNNPFVPFNEIKEEETKAKFDMQSAKLKYDLVDPPNSSTADSDAEKILTTKVSGIMYDAQSPSALLNIEDSDYLVRSGDVVNGYKILAISPSVVTVQLGSNVYKAGVGELLVTDGIQYNTISNLSNKFGGSKK